MIIIWINSECIHVYIEAICPSQLDTDIHRFIFCNISKETSNYSVALIGSTQKPSLPVEYFIIHMWLKYMWLNAWMCAFYGDCSVLYTFRFYVFFQEYSFLFQGVHSYHRQNSCCDDSVSSLQKAVLNCSLQIQSRCDKMSKRYRHEEVSFLFIAILLMSGVPSTCKYKSKAIEYYAVRGMQRNIC